MALATSMIMLAALRWVLRRLVGLAMFFLYPYWLHRSHRGA